MDTNPPGVTASGAAAGGPPMDPITALSAGWQAFLARPLASLGVLLILLAIQVACGFIPFVNFLAGLLVSPALLAGGAWFFLRGIRRERPEFETAFEGFQRWPSVTGAILLVGLVEFLIALPLLATIFATIGLTALVGSRSHGLPAIAGLATFPILLTAMVTVPVSAWWHARSAMVYFAVMEPDRPAALEALKRSFALTKGSVWRIVMLALLWVPVVLVGLLALCVGVLPAALVIYYSFAHAYEQLRARAGLAAPPAA